MRTTSVKKMGLVFAILAMVMIQTVKADMMFYYSAAILPSIIASSPPDDLCPDGSSFINHNGTNYCPVTSPYTGEVWLDRNLGAAQVCTALDDTACYGDYYQWGRNFDGHQNSSSGTTATQATDVDDAGVEFITSSDTYDFDWAQEADGSGSTRAINWSEIDGTSVCPIGYRVPTEAELEAETTGAGVADNADAFSSFLKLPSADRRSFSNGIVYNAGSQGFVWSASVNGTGSQVLSFDSSDAGWFYNFRAFGCSVRCLKD